MWIPQILQIICHNICDLEERMEVKNLLLFIDLPLCIVIDSDVSRDKMSLLLDILFFKL